jgi:hypothetical protein
MEELISTNETVSSMNGTLWIFAVLLIVMVVIQAVLFLKLALRFNAKNKLLTREELKSVARTGAISVIGPGISNIVVALSLIAMVGPAVAFMRCGVIGAPPWELFMANIAAGTVGVQFNTPEFTQAVFVLCIFGMTFASAPYFINTIITLKPLDSAILKGQAAKESKEGKEKVSFIPMLGNAAMMGILGYSIIDYFKTPAQITAVVAASLVSFAVVRIAAKKSRRWLGDWNMAISMVVGMTAGQIVAGILA